MRAILGSFILVLFLSLAFVRVCSAQSGVQAGIFNPGGDTLAIKAKPTNAISGKLFSAVNVTIRWLASYGITLGPTSGSYGIIAQGNVVTDGTYDYQSFGSIPDVTITWAAGSENELFVVPVTGGTGTGTFEITNVSPANPWYFEIGGFDSTDNGTPFYQSVVNNVPLPIQLSTFTGAAVDQNDVRLEWTTLSEVNNYGFYVQRRGEKETSFKDLPNNFIAGHGTTAKPNKYSFLDDSPKTDTLFYYRLKQQDQDGTVHLYPGISVSTGAFASELAPKEFHLFQNFPNPFNPATEVKFSVESDGKATLRVYNIIGQVVATLYDDVARAGQYYRVQFNASSLASGVYLFRLQSGGKSDLKKMLLLK